MSAKGMGLVVVLGIGVTLLSMAIGLCTLQMALQRRDPPPDAFLGELMSGEFETVPLPRSRVFSGPHVGYSVQPSPMAAAFWRVLRGPRAEERLERLAARGEPGARLYGLCGLRVLRSSLFAGAMADAETDGRRVAVANGCSLSVMPVREALRGAAFERVCQSLAVDAR